MPSLAEEVSGHRFLRGMSESNVEAVLATLQRDESWSPDEVIFSSGAPAVEVFLVLTGDAAVEVHAPGSGSRIIQTLRGDQVLGWSWMLPPHRWTFDARALTPTRAAVLDAVELRAAANDDPALGFEIVTRVARAMSDRLQSTRLQLLDLYAHRS